MQGPFKWRQLISRVEFIGDYDFSPEAKNGNVMIARKSGASANVTTECAKKSIVAGKAVKKAKVVDEQEIALAQWFTL